MLEVLLKARAHYAQTSMDCKILQALPRKTFEQILTILGRPLERHKSWSEVYLFQDLSDAQVTALLNFLVARKIIHRWILEMDFIKKKPPVG